MRVGAISACFLATANVAMAAALPQRIVSFNIRYDASDRQDGEKPWSDRSTGVIDQLKTVINIAVTDGAVPIIGLQEVLDNQLADIQGGLGVEWNHFGFGRDDGSKEGEYNPILFRTDIVKLVHSEQKWLSPTPDEPSFGWDAGSRRVSVIAVFEHLATGKRFIHANTHLDNASGQARSEGIKVVVARIQAVQQQYGPLGVTLTGDFNSEAGGDAYAALEATGYLTEVSKSEAKLVGTNQLTYTGFSGAGISKIDFVWFGPSSENLYSAQQYEILNNDIGGTFISDHRPVVADVTLL
ncbi:Endonuclease/exonuclease/phosphatase [Jackrogersella minutella]|nr:Endonuclease/exonuclease/phosphatase [Jackrogersella minutella]